jgi:hypothetical protein
VYFTVGIGKPIDIGFSQHIYMTISLDIAKERILEIYQKIDTNSKYYGRLLNWYKTGVWHYGIGISNNLVFDTASLKLFNRADLDIRLVPNVQIFTPSETIDRLCSAILCFHTWDYGLLGWNCEHLARLVATDKAISYEVKKLPFPLPQLNNDGWHPQARRLLNEYRESYCDWFARIVA